ncbi:hypothetical protein FOXYSP1_05594 [Fusarium oxysporum f. sp. phaseoli]
MAFPAASPLFSSSYPGILWLWHSLQLAVTGNGSVNGLGYHWMASAFVHAPVYLRRLSPHLHSRSRCLMSSGILVSVTVSQQSWSYLSQHSDRHAWFAAFLKLFVEVRPFLGTSSLSPESLDESISPYPTYTTLRGALV